MAEHMELLGADYCEHLVFHPGCGVTRAVSVLGHVPGIRWAPGHVMVGIVTRAAHQGQGGHQHQTRGRQPGARQVDTGAAVCW